MESVLHDVRYALRRIRLEPGFAAIVVLTLSIGIGATCSMFGVVNALLFRPLPFKDADRLVRMRDAVARPGSEPWLYNTSPRSFVAMKEWDGAFENVTAQRFMTVSLTDADAEPRRLTAIGVSGGWLATLGVRPALGRGFTASETRVGRASRVALIGYRLWDQQFGASPDAVGRTIVLDDRPYTVVGVMPAQFNYPYGAELWIPETFDRNSGEFGPNVVARLKPAIDLRSAQAQLDILSRRLRLAYPESHASVTLRAVPMRDDLIGNDPRLGITLLGAVAFLLLIACANVANLMLVRSTARSAEIALRTALGAPRSRQVRRVVTEAAVLASLSAVVGLVMAASVADGLTRLSGTEYEFLGVPRIDIRVVAFTVGLAAVTTLLFAVIPAFRATRPDPQVMLKARGQSGESGNGMVMPTLAAAEVALAFVLLSGAALLAHSLSALHREDPGYDAKERLAVDLTLPSNRYPAPTDQVAFVDQLILQVQSIPGVVSAGLTSQLPLTQRSTTRAISIRGGPSSEPGRHILVNWRAVTPEYFGTMDIRLLAGSDFDPGTTRQPRAVAIVSQRFARRYWPNEQPVGRQFKFGELDSDNPWLTVIAIAEDIDELYEVDETAYVPFGLSPPRDLSLVVHTATDPLSYAAPVRAAIWSVDPRQAVEDLTTLDGMLSDALSPEKVSARLMQAFAAFALLLAVLGLYGVTSFAVSCRTREFGIRMALGATPRSIRGIVVRRGSVLVALGVATGCSLALVVNDLIVKVLAGVVPDVPVQARLVNESTSLPTATYFALTLALFLVSTLASLFAADRGARVDPVEALRRG